MTPPADLNFALRAAARKGDEAEVLFVYSREQVTDPPQSSPPCVSIEEDAERGLAVYTVSLPMPAREQIDEVAGWMLRLYEAMTVWNRECVLAVRDEAGLDCGRTAVETLEYALGPLNAGWVVAPERLGRALPEPPDDGLVEAVGGGAVLVRRYRPLF